MQFVFKITKGKRDPSTLIFAKMDQLMELNFDTEVTSVLYEYEVPLSRQPNFFLMSDDQTICIMASQDDGIYYNFRTRFYFDLDQEYRISFIKEIIHDHEDGVFYLLANKYEDKLGLFMIRLQETNPYNHNFFIKWKNKLDIADADIAVVRNEEKKLKELVVSYKTIFINTYNVKVVDISGDI